jgi:hypothetical protein
MKNYVLYEDDELRVELDGLFHKMIKESHVQTINPNKNTTNLLLSLAVAELKKRGVEKKGRKFLCCSNSPVISYGQGIGLSEPFNVFDAGLNFLAMQEDINSNIDDLEQALSDMYMEHQNKKVYCKVFKKPFNQIKGYLVAEEEDQFIILFWAYEEFEDDDGDFEDDDEDILL